MHKGEARGMRAARRWVWIMYDVASNGYSERYIRGVSRFHLAVFGLSWDPGLGGMTELEKRARAHPICTFWAEKHHRGQHQGCMTS